MLNIIRRVLVVDDSPHTYSLKISNYLEIFKRDLQNEYNYEIEFIWRDSIKGALELLNEKVQVFHVLLVDYNFTNDEDDLKGIYFVNEVRKTINKRCKIIFYTMEGYEGIEKEEYFKLINSNIFRFIPKEGLPLDSINSRSRKDSDELVVEAIRDAITESDPISNALESFLVQYNDILKDVKISIGDSEYTIEQLVDSIRLDTDIGNLFINKMLKMSILDFIDFLD